jgi:signal-transduction protein with cAMP-binding, CBS, and nucleotidyltransferase domain
MPTRRATFIGIAAAVGTICGAIVTSASVLKIGRDYFDARCASRPAFERFTHDDTLRHQYAEKQRARQNFVIDSIERAHQRPARGRVLQAGEPRDPAAAAK